MAEGKERTGLVLVYATITHVNAFLVFLIYNLLIGPPCAGKGVELVCRHVVEGAGPREGQLTRWVGLSRQHVGDAMTGLGTDEPSLHNGVHTVSPRHGNGVARDIDNDEIAVCLGQSLNHTVLPIGEGIVLSVVSLAVLVVALVESSEEDNVVGLECLGHGVGDKLVGRAALAEVLTARYAVVRAIGVAYRSEERRVGKECRSRWSPYH